MAGVFHFIGPAHFGRAETARTGPSPTLRVPRPPGRRAAHRTARRRRARSAPRRAGQDQRGRNRARASEAISSKPRSASRISIACEVLSAATRQSTPVLVAKAAASAGPVPTRRGGRRPCARDQVAAHGAGLPVAVALRLPALPVHPRGHGRRSRTATRSASVMSDRETGSTTAVRSARTGERGAITRISFREPR